MREKERVWQSASEGPLFRVFPRALVRRRRDGREWNSFTHIVLMRQLRDV